MTLFQIVSTLKAIGANQPNIRTTSDGSIYDKLNTNPSVQYDVFHITQTTHREDEEYDYYGFNLFYVSRLEDSLEDNRLQIQSIGKEVLSNIIRTLCKNWQIDFPQITYMPFTQKFTDLCAGVYCNIQLEVPKEIVCADDYTAETVPGTGIKLQDMTATITQNGLRVFTPDAEYDGIGEIRIDVQVPQTTAVLEDKEYDVTENGEYTIYPDPDYDGMTSVALSVEVPDRYQDGYDAGYNEGEEDQKAKLSTTSFTVNSSYTLADGWSAITVNVPQTGSTIHNQDKTFYLSSVQLNSELVPVGGGHYLFTGSTTVTYDSGYTGLGTATIIPEISAGEAIELGENNQKAKLSSTSFTQNSAYTSENGWSSVTVDVDDRYYEGYDDGEEAQKNKLIMTSVTENGVYTREDGFYAIEVNVPVTAYTDADLIANLQADYFVIPSGTTELRPYAFYQQCFSSITIPDTVTGIGEYSFAYNTCLEDVTIPSSVTSIGNGAFLEDSGITGMTFESLVPPTLVGPQTSLGDPAYTYPIYVPCASVDAYKSAFTAYASRIQCIDTSLATGLTLNVASGITGTGIATVTIEPSTAITDIHFTTSDNTIAKIDDNGVITVVEDGQVTICTYDSRSGLQDCKIVDVAKTAPLYIEFVYSSSTPNQTVVLYDPTVGETTSDELKVEWLESITMEVDGTIVSASSAYTFETPGRHIVRYITPKTYIPCKTFSKRFSNSGFSDELIEVHLPNGIEAVDWGAFDSTESLTALTLPSTLKYFGSYPFTDIGISDLVLPASLTNSGFPYITEQYFSQHWFMECQSLTSVTIGSGLTYLPTGAFSGCTALSSITLPSNITSIKTDVFRKCTSLSSITINGGITSIGGSSFRGCTSLSAITFPNTVTEIGNDCFHGCTGLTNMEIPDSVKIIGDHAFQGTSITNLTIGSGITNIGYQCVYHIRSLSSITITATVPPTLGSYAFGDRIDTAPIYVPADSVDTYKTAWPNYAGRITAINS